jgi:hypothetical protein
MTALRKRMLEELQRRNYSPTTARAYLYAVEEFARYFRKSPDELDQEQLRQYQLHLLHDRKLTIGTIVGRIAALRFFFVAAPSSILTPFCISWHANLVGRSQMSVAGVIKFVPVAHDQCDRPPELAFSQSLANIENVSRAGLSGSGQRSSASCAERHYPERDNLPLKISPSVVPKAQAILWIRNAKTRIRATRATAVYFSKHSPHPLLERAVARVLGSVKTFRQEKL